METHNEKALISAFCIADEAKRLDRIKKHAYEDLYELAEIENGELYDQDDECEEVEYMLEKIMQNGTYHDAVHGIHHFIDYVHANDALKCIQLEG